MANTYAMPDGKLTQELKDIANKLRIHSITSTNAANSGHPTSCCSAAEIMSTLFFHAMRYTVTSPRSASNDRFVMSKGHAAPILYAAWAETGLFSVDELAKLRKLNCLLEGHPTPRSNFVDVATGSLGQGLSCSAGMAYAGKYFDNASYRVYCLIGDGESAEGSIWEALHFASHYALDNLTAIFDINRLGQSDPTSLQHDIETYRKRLEAFGWQALVVDGHSVEDLCKAYGIAMETKNKPTCILAKTFKGKGISGIEDQENWHGKPLGAKANDAIATLMKEIKNPGPHGLIPASPLSAIPDAVDEKFNLSEPPNYNIGDKVATRLAYGTGLAKLGKSNSRVVALDGDTKNSTFSIKMKEMNAKQYIECYIAEQNMIGVAIGLATRGRTVPFVSTFSCFLGRGFDQLRMGGISTTTANFCGSHSGISIGEDGPSQMGLEDLALFRTIPGCVVFAPSDAVSTERAVELAANTKSMCYIRTCRPNVPVIYANTEPFAVGKAKIIKQSSGDHATVIGSCVTLDEAMKASVELAKEGIHIRIVDPFTIKPLDIETIMNSAMQTGGRILVVEDHYREGGIGEAVMSAMADNRNILIKHLAVGELPKSGKPEELLDLYGISAKHIAAAVTELVKM